MTSTPPDNTPDYGPGGDDATHEFGHAPWTQQPAPEQRPSPGPGPGPGGTFAPNPYSTPSPAPYSGPPSYDAPPAYPDQQYAGQQYAQPAYGQADQQGHPQQYGQDYAGQQQYGQGYPGQPLGTPDYQPAAPAKPKRTKLLITSSAAVVVLAAGGVGTYVAVSDSGDSGAGSPTAAVQTAVTDLDHSDLIGLLDDLAPSERDALAKPVSDTINQLKRNDVLASNADPTNVSGLQFTSKDLTYAPTTVTVNDHVQIVQITGGTITVNGDASKLPLSKDFLDAIVPGGLHQSKTSTIDIAKELAKDHRSGVRIATQKVDGKWYPSLFYTVADNATYKRGEPTAADAIPAKGASTPDGAVTTLIQSAVAENADGLVQILSPDEMAVLHDYGHFITRKSRFGNGVPIKVSGLTYETTDLDGGAKMLSTQSATITTGNRTIKSVRHGDCYAITQQGETRNFCGGTTGANSISALISGFSGRPLTKAQITAISDAFSSLSKFGVVVSQSGGQWYVDPVRTVVSLFPTVLSGLKQGDLLTLVSLAKG